MYISPIQSTLNKNYQNQPLRTAKCNAVNCSNQINFTAKKSLAEKIIAVPLTAFTGLISSVGNAFFGDDDNDSSNNNNSTGKSSYDSNEAEFDSFNSRMHDNY